VAEPAPRTAAAGDRDRSPDSDSRGLAGAGPRRTAWLGACVLLMLLFVAFRTIALDADPPFHYIQDDIGYHVDEGYKTLAPRNLLLFDRTSWNEHDEYKGWMSTSAITQWPFYFAFKYLGLDRTSSRLVNVGFFASVLGLSTAFLWKRYPVSVALTGVTLLGVDAGLFHFSRISLLEMALCAVIYPGVFLASLCSRRGWALPILVLLGTAAVATFGVKLTAMMYVLPPIAAMVALLTLHRLKVNLASVVSAVVALALMAWFLYTTSGVWFHRLEWASLRNPSLLFLNPVHQLSPLAFGLAFLALADIVLRKGLSAFRASDPYLTILASITVGAPLILALFHDPARYYVAVLPATLLVLVEWIALWRSEWPATPIVWNVGRVVTASLLVPFFAASVQGFLSDHVMTRLPFVPQGDEPGVSEVVMNTVYPFVAVLVLIAFGIAGLRGWLERHLGQALVAALLIHVSLSLAIDLSSLARPAYDIAAINRKLVGLVRSGESVAGVWAPLFTIEGTVPSIYMMEPEWNTGADLERLRPTYFIDSHTQWDEMTREALATSSSLGLGTAIPLGRYYGYEISAVPIEYRGLARSQ
jgi:hypothetical protein